MSTRRSSLRRLCAGLKNGGLQEDDLPPQSHVDDPVALHTRFHALLTEKRRLQREDGRPPSRFMLLSILYTMFGTQFFFTGVLLLLFNICQLATPHLLQMLLSFLESPRRDNHSTWAHYEG